MINSKKNFVNLDKEAEKIEKIVLELQKELYINAGEPKETRKLLGLFNPISIIKFKGYDYQEVQDLGSVLFNKDKYETAGIVDHLRKIVAISLKFKPHERRFTTGHELGHILLHPHLSLHRDRPIESERPKGIFDFIEWQANKVATYSLMPKFLVLREIKKRFGKSLPLTFDDNVSFILNPRNPENLMRSEEKSLNREIAMATYTDGGKIISLVELFGVSIEAMARRLQELGVVRYP